MIVGVVGLGLIGGSIARALNGRFGVVAVDTDGGAVEYALENGIIRRGGRDFATLKDCGAVFVCVPPKATADVVNRVYGAVGSGAVITDTASVKGFTDKIDKRARFVPGHPMAGTENSGIRNSRADLFKDARYVLLGGAAERDVKAVAELVGIMGARAVFMELKEHDAVMAKVSHLPHIAAYCLVDNSLGGGKIADAAGGGFYDITRIASSEPALWAEIAVMNKDNLLSEIRGFKERLSAVERALEAGDAGALSAYFDKAKLKRDALKKKSGR